MLVNLKGLRIPGSARNSVQEQGRDVHCMGGGGGLGEDPPVEGEVRVWRTRPIQTRARVTHA